MLVPPSSPILPGFLPSYPVPLAAFLSSFLSLAPTLSQLSSCLSSLVSFFPPSLCPSLLLTHWTFLTQRTFSLWRIYPHFFSSVRSVTELNDPKVCKN